MTVELSAPSPEEVEPRLLLGAKDPLRIRDGLHQVRPGPLSASRYWSLRSPYDDTIATRAHATRTSTARPIPRPAHLLQMQQSSLTVVDAAKHYPSIADALNASQTIQKAKRDSGHTDQASHSVRARLHGLCHFHAAIPACLPLLFLTPPLSLHALAFRLRRSSSPRGTRHPLTRPFLLL